MKTIIHIGQHKTGTTSIQKALQDNRQALAESGLYVPSSIAGYQNPSHFILNVYTLEANRYSSMKETIIATKGKHYLNELGSILKKDIATVYKKAQANQCDQVIWSNEGLYLLNTVVEYKRLRDLFSKHSTDIEVVCCFRDVTSYRASYIKQLKKQAIYPSMTPDSYRYWEPNSWLFDYQRKKRLLSEVFAQCTYFKYDAVDNVKAFMETIGYSVIDTSRYRLNISDQKNSGII